MSLHGLLVTDAGEELLVHEQDTVEVVQLGPGQPVTVELNVFTQPHVWLRLFLTPVLVTHVFRQRPHLVIRNAEGNICINRSSSPLTVVISADGRVRLLQGADFLSFRIPLLHWSQLNLGPREVKRDGHIAADGLLREQNAGMHFQLRGRRTWLVPDHLVKQQTRADV